MSLPPHPGSLPDGGREKVKVLVFDAYGTLLDVHAAMAAHAEKLPPDWERISAEWRAKQMEYTWVRTLTGDGQHRDFWTLTREALAFVAERNRVTDPSVIAALLESYRYLKAYPDARPALQAVRGRGIKTGILSNGEPGMLADAVGSAGLAPLLDALLSVEAVGAFKTDRRAYLMMTERFGLAPDEIGFVSSNAWDAYAAGVFGYRVFWVNRFGQPDEYGLRASATEIASLSDLI